MQMELPYAAIGLVWNSMMSVAGGWFFLIACEMFVLGNRDLRLPGLGSYLQTAANAGDTRAIFWGLAVMVGVIVLMDQLIWRPVIAWAEKFKFEQVEAVETPHSPVLDLSAALEDLPLVAQRDDSAGARRLTCTSPKRADGPRERSSREQRVNVLGGVRLALAGAGHRLCVRENDALLVAA